MKPVFPIKITSLNNTSVNLDAVFDTGSFYTIIRADKLPADTMVIRYDKTFRTAQKGGTLAIVGQTILNIAIEDRMINDRVLVSSELGSDMLIGAQTMQSWDISIMNNDGKTTIHVAHDMRDPEITEVV